MTNLKILVLGRGGQVGWELRHRLACMGTVIGMDFPEVDFSKADSLRETVQAVAPAVIVNAAAYTAVDKAESEIELAMAINGTAPGVLAEEAKRLGSVLVHYSTDYVFRRHKARAVCGERCAASDECLRAVEAGGR
jgi:dTDP-4-dehydrorhamnose reductase